jgi:hypothetical protein
MRLGLDNPPPEFVGLKLMPVPPGVTMATRIAGNMDMVIGFYERRRELEKRLPVLRRRIPEDGVIWIAWPKKTSRVPTDLSEDVIRELAGPAGLKGIRVSDIDQVWSGLRLEVDPSESGGDSGD